MPVGGGRLIFAQYGHHHVKLPYVVNVHPQPAAGSRGDGGKPLVHRVGVCKQDGAGPYAARIILPRIVAVKFQNRHDGGVKDLIYGRMLIVVQHGGLARREAVQHKRGGKTAAHHGGNLARLFRLELLALNTRRNAEDDDYEKHRRPVCEDVHKRHSGNAGKFAPTAHGFSSTYSRM